LISLSSPVFSSIRLPMVSGKRHAVCPGPLSFPKWSSPTQIFHLRALSLATAIFLCIRPGALLRISSRARVRSPWLLSSYLSPPSPPNCLQARAAFLPLMGSAFSTPVFSNRSLPAMFFLKTARASYSRRRPEFGSLSFSCFAAVPTRPFTIVFPLKRVC